MKRIFLQNVFWILAMGSFGGVHFLTSASRAEEIHIDPKLRVRIDHLAKKTGCSNPNYAGAIEGPLFGSSKKNLIFSCSVGEGEWRIVIDADRIPCAKMIPFSNGIRKLEVVSAKEGFGNVRYEQLTVVESKRYEKYKGPDKNRLVTSGNALLVCLTDECSVTSTFVCHQGKWLHWGAC